MVDDHGTSRFSRRESVQGAGGREVGVGIRNWCMTASYDDDEIVYCVTKRRGLRSLT